MDMYTWLKICTIAKCVFWGYFRCLKCVGRWSEVPFCLIYHNLKPKSQLGFGLRTLLYCSEVPGKVETVILPSPYHTGHRSSDKIFFFFFPCLSGNWKNQVCWIDAEVCWVFNIWVLFSKNMNYGSYFRTV